jgi:hypothetical protein
MIDTELQELRRAVAANPDMAARERLAAALRMAGQPECDALGHIWSDDTPNEPIVTRCPIFFWCRDCGLRVLGNNVICLNIRCGMFCPVCY